MCNHTQGVEAVAIHGDKSQEDRADSFDAFNRGDKDVMVATDVASKVSAFVLFVHILTHVSLCYHTRIKTRCVFPA